MGLDIRIGRLLVASLHQGITEAVPTRVEFYEHWLSPTGLREGRTGLAALGAALSFMRRESAPTYHSIMTRAGVSAADWTYVELPAYRRRVSDRMPITWRASTALRVARALVKDTFHDTKLRTAFWKSNGTLRLRGSVFCSTRATSGDALCVYYAAAIERLLALYRVDAEITIRECKAAGLPQCVLGITVRGARDEAPTLEVG